MWHCIRCPRGAMRSCGSRDRESNHRPAFQPFMHPEPCSRKNTSLSLAFFHTYHAAAAQVTGQGKKRGGGACFWVQPYLPTLPPPRNLPAWRLTSPHPFRDALVPCVSCTTRGESNRTFSSDHGSHCNRRLPSHVWDRAASLVPFLVSLPGQRNDRCEG